MHHRSSEAAITVPGPEKQMAAGGGVLYYFGEQVHDGASNATK
jgi:hypothetical protein